MRRRALLASVSVQQNESIPNNMIFYTSSDQQIVEPYANDFGANLVSNTYIGGKGQMVFGGDITHIGGYAFYDCLNLASIEIPNSVTSIGDHAFEGCDQLSSVYVKATTPPTLDKYAFHGNPFNRKIYVPRASLNAYKTASGWSEYASSIEPYDFDGNVNEITFYIDDDM